MGDDRTYVKLHDGFPDHPKTARVGGDAAWLWVCSLCYCSRHLTDGIFPKAVVTRLSDRKNVASLTEQLLTARMWEEHDEDHYKVHDYTEHQRSAADVAALRSKRQDAGKRGGIAKANALASATASAKQPPGKSLPETDTEKENTPPTPPAGGRTTKRAAPDSFEITDDLRAWAAEKGLKFDLDAQTEEFLNHHRAKGSRFSDWAMAWRNWMTRAVRYEPGLNGEKSVGGVIYR